MTSLEDLHGGCVYTHLNVLYQALEQAVRDSRDDGIDAALQDLQSDPVHRAITAREFRAPSPSRASAPGNRLAERIRRIRMEASSRPASPTLSAFLGDLDTFLKSDAEPWGNGDYLTVPVMMRRSRDRKPGLTYLKLGDRFISDSSTSGVLLYGLTKDPALSGQLMDTALRTFFLVKRLPVDLEEHVAQFVYRLYFKCEITEGRSMGAALLVAFTIALLRSLLLDSYKQTVTLHRGIVITGGIEDDHVTPSDDVDEKVCAALEEYGPSVRVIVPANSPLSRSVKSRIPAGNISEVDTTEELLAAALGGPAATRTGLMAARRKVLMRYPRLQQALDAARLPQFPSGVHTRIALGQSLFPPRGHDGVFVSARSWYDQIDLRLGLNGSALNDDD